MKIKKKKFNINKFNSNKFNNFNLSSLNTNISRKKAKIKKNLIKDFFLKEISYQTDKDKIFNIFLKRQNVKILKIAVNNSEFQLLTNKKVVRNLFTRL